MVDIELEHRLLTGGAACPAASSARRNGADMSCSPATSTAAESLSRVLTRTSETRSPSESLTRLSSDLLSLSCASAFSLSAALASAAELEIAAGRVRELLAFELLQVVHDPGVDAPP